MLLAATPISALASLLAGTTLSVVSVAPVFADTATLPVSADALVGSGGSGFYDPTRNNGTSTTLGVGRVSPGTVRTYISFDLSGLPAGATITSASLTFYTKQMSCAGTTNGVGLSHVQSTWAESTVTWNNMPGVGTTITSGTVSANNRSSSITPATGPAGQTQTLTLNYRITNSGSVALLIGCLAGPWRTRSGSRWGAICRRFAGCCDRGAADEISAQGTAVARGRLLSRWWISAPRPAPCRTASESRAPQVVIVGAVCLATSAARREPPTTRLDTGTKRPTARSEPRAQPSALSHRGSGAVVTGLANNPG